ncbi:MAG TPA: HAD-IB family phosphatase [Longimicrobiaceae bacterium]|nr:HAD-IB family phosphatase [Longimicrobiaceae bacterium]
MSPLRRERLGARSIIFDCDSTLCGIEGIDELAGEQAAEIRALTEAAMEGALALEEVYGRRLELIRPSRARVADLGRLYIERLVEDARPTVAALRWLGKQVRIISGGLRPPVEAVARALELEAADVGAVGIAFEDDGAYADFERGSPLARSGGKAAVVRAWALERPVMLVGDGATDLEARPEVDLFVAYMGVAYRPKVAVGADIVLTAPSLAPVLAIASNAEDRHRLRESEWAGILERGLDLLARF